MSAKKIKSGALIVAGIGGTAFGIKHLTSSGKAVVAPPERGTTINTLANNLHQVGQTTTSERDHSYYDNDYEHEDTSYKTSSRKKRSLDLSLPQTKYQSTKEFNENADWNWIAEQVNYTEEQKAKNRRDAEKHYKTLNDYSFKIFMPCGWGTGWILDYKLPEKTGDYPTTWYIATNAHVAWRLRFSENPYNQKLPIYDKNTKWLREKNQSEFKRITEQQTEVRGKCWAVDKLGYIDLNLSQQDNGPTRNADVGAISLGEMKEPKLLFSAFNFLDRGVNSYLPADHCIDFVVLEIEFTSQDAARKTTNGFATKYKANQNAINLFGKPIEKKYQTKRELWESKDNFYRLGYPKGAENKWVYTKNWHEGTTVATHLEGEAKYADIEETKNKYRGIMRADLIADVGMKWQGEIYKEIGHFWTLKWNPMDGGSSGSLFIDADGNAIAVTGNGAINSLIHWAIPLRSAGMTEEEAGFKSPKWDLILGTDGQTSSYKQQIEKYILKDGKTKTWLSTQEGWKTKVV